MTEKINLNSIENINKVKDLINKGITSGTLKKKYGVNKQSFKLIKNDHIDLKNEKVECLLCNSKFLYLYNRHLSAIHNINQEKYLELFPNAKIISANKIIEASNRNIGKKLSEETKNKIRNINLGKKHSKKTLNKLSKMFSGDKNPSTRPDVKKIIKEKHLSKKDPIRWRETVDRVARKNKGKKRTEEQKLNLAEARKKSMRYGSRGQLFAYKYIKHYLGIFFKTKVFSNDHCPFLGICSKNYNVDISIPEFKLAIEWDGIWHRTPICGENLLKKVQEKDRIKECLLHNNNWSLIRVDEELKNDSNFKSGCIKIIRKLIKEEIFPFIFSKYY